MNLTFILFAVAAVADWLGTLPAGRWLGGAIISLLLGILLANVGLIPTVSNAPPLYQYLIAVGAPVAIFLLLLDVRLQALKRAQLVTAERDGLHVWPCGQARSVPRSWRVLGASVS
jgi:hypothetical protein